MDASDDDGNGGLARAHAGRLLGLFGLSGAGVSARSDHPALAWRRAGLCAVTGWPRRPGLVAPVPLTAAADGALAAFRALAPYAPLPANGALLLGERARLLGLSRKGATSANGSCRLIAARGGRIALNLPRADDWTLIPALLGEPAADWAAIARVAAYIDRDELVAQGRLLGLAIASDIAVAPPGSPYRIARMGSPRERPGVPLVVDLSSLWAGPLAGGLLHAAGARVVKVESRRRPDGGRRGDRRFVDLLNASKASVALDFADRGDLAALRRLIDAADIVIESARPRALVDLGIDAAAFARGGGTWISITGHGRDGDAANWIGFGDDAAVAGGLAAAMATAWGAPMFAGDAIADPLTGLTAALAAMASWRAGGGRLVSIALADVVADACALGATRDVRRWQAMAAEDVAPLYPLREAPEAARALGADTASVLARFAG